MNKNLVSIVLLILLTSSIITYIIFNNKKSETIIIEQPIIKNFNGIQKHHINLGDYVESTPFVWKNELKYLTINRELNSNEPTLSIFDFKTKNKIIDFGRGINLASALVKDEILYVYGTKKWGQKGESELYVISSKDLQTFSEPELIYKAPPGLSFFNNTVTYNENDKKFIMALETDEDFLAAFSIRFFESYDNKNWNPVHDQVFGKNVYVACPAIRYLNGNYYMWYLVERRNDPNCQTCITYVVNLAQSSDLINWKISNHDFLVPNPPHEGINSSDMDLTEFNNQVYIFYSVGDQATWTKLKYATYNGNLEKLVSNFFP